MKTFLTYTLIALAAILFLAPDLGAQDTVRSREQVTGQAPETRQSQQTQRSQGNRPTEQPQQAQNQKFVDLDGDGYNDNAPDHDGDGIPNGLDPDWKRRKRTGRPQFIDLNGDGINDNLQQEQNNSQELMNPGAVEEDGTSLKNQEQRQMRKVRKGPGKSGS
jgi:hypothetical protein